MVMPEMAFDPDMSGVCSVGGTLVMTSNPTKEARTKTVTPTMRVELMSAPRRVRRPARS